MTDPTRHGELTAPGAGHHSRHSWMMIACCVPMLVIAVAIALSGAGVGFLFAAIGCTAMMAMMMRGMSHDSQPDHTTRSEPRIR